MRATYLLFLLIVSIGFGIRQKSQKETIAKYEDRLVSAQHQLEEAKTLTTLNGSRARELLFSARETATELKNEGVKDVRLEELLTGIAANIGTIAGVYEVTPEIYLDLSLISQGFKADDAAYSEGRMLVLDRSGRLVSIDVATKKTRVIAGPEKIEGARFTTVYSDRNFVLTNDGVSEVSTADSEEVVEKDWDDAAGLHAYAANLYILDKGENAIWRYAGADSGFGSQKNWFAPGIEVDLGNVISWSIDGSIWLLTESGEVEKYTNGNPQTFRLLGSTDLSGAVDIFSDDTTEYLYILDQEKRKILVTDKEGEYKAEYTNDLLGEANQLIVSEEEKKIILIAGDKLYSIDIKHL